MEITLQTTEGPLSFPAGMMGRWTLLFYYGSDFSPVAATELLALSALKEDFDRAGAKILAVGSDSIASHLAFSAALERYRLEAAPPSPIAFPIAYDEGGALQEMLGLSPQNKYLWLISPEGEAKAMHSYPLDTGANFTESLRTLLALQTERPTPHGWTPGAHALLPPPQTQKERISHMDRSEQQGGYCIDWYICFEGERNDETALPQ